VIADRPEHVRDVVEIVHPDGLDAKRLAHDALVRFRLPQGRVEERVDGGKRAPCCARRFELIARANALFVRQPIASLDLKVPRSVARVSTRIE